VLVRVTDAEYVDVVRGVFGSASVCADEPRVDLVYGSGRLGLPRRKPDERHEDLDVWRDDDVLHLASDVHGVRARVTPTRARVVTNGFVPERGFRRVFQPLITHVLAHYGIYVVHGASMHKSGKGIVVLGESGKGKSTMAAAALQHDWRVMGDDLVALRLVDGTPMIRGLPKPMALPSDIDHARGDGVDAATLEWDQRERLHVPADRLDLEEVALGALVVVEHGTDTHTTEEVLTGDQGASLLMASFTSVGNARLMRAFFPVAMRAARVPCRLVRHGTDPVSRLADAQAILARMAQQW